MKGSYISGGISRRSTIDESTAQVKHIRQSLERVKMVQRDTLQVCLETFAGRMQSRAPVIAECVCRVAHELGGVHEELEHAYRSFSF